MGQMAVCKRRKNCHCSHCRSCCSGLPDVVSWRKKEFSDFSWRSINWNFCTLYKYTNHLIAHYRFVFLIFSPAFVRLECDQTEILSNIITAMLRLATKASCVEYACQVTNHVTAVKILLLSTSAFPHRRWSLPWNKSRTSWKVSVADVPRGWLVYWRVLAMSFWRNFNCSSTTCLSRLAPSSLIKDWMPDKILSLESLRRTARRYLPHLNISLSFFWLH